MGLNPVPEKALINDQISHMLLKANLTFVIGSTVLMDADHKLDHTIRYWDYIQDISDIMLGLHLQSIHPLSLTGLKLLPPSSSSPFRT
jgi:hypothetical protein